MNLRCCLWETTCSNDAWSTMLSFVTANKRPRISALLQYQNSEQSALGLRLRRVRIRVIVKAKVGFGSVSTSGLDATTDMVLKEAITVRKCVCLNCVERLSGADLWLEQSPWKTNVRRNYPSKCCFTMTWWAWSLPVTWQRCRWCRLIRHSREPHTEMQTSRLYLLCNHSYCRSMTRECRIFAFLCTHAGKYKKMFAPEKVTPVQSVVLRRISERDHFRSRHKVGGHSIPSAVVENPTEMVPRLRSYVGRSWFELQELVVSPPRLIWDADDLKQMQHERRVRRGSREQCR